MALFKISKGDSSKLGVQPLYEGHAWFTPDDGKFYIDAFVKRVVNGTEQDVLTRIPLCADRADYDGDGRNIRDTYSNFYITALKDNTANTISADKTYQEIVNAYEAGSNLILEYYDSSFADYPRILPLYSWFGQGENITFGFSGAYNKPTSDVSNIDATEVISIMYNQSVGWKVFIDQMVTAVDGETGKITTNAVKFIKQDLTVSQRNQAKENIFAAGIAQTLVKTLPQANAISKFTDDKDYPTLTDSNIYAVDDKLGVNTASPTATLTVAGDASIGSNLEVNGEVSSNTLKLAVASGSKSFVMDTTGTNGGMSIGFVLNTGSKQNLILEGINDKIKIKNLATISDSDDKTYVVNKEYVDNQFNKFVGEDPTQDLQYIKRKDGVGTGITSLENVSISDTFLIRENEDGSNLIAFQAANSHNDLNRFDIIGDKDFLIDVSSNIGIGTDSPLSKVHLMGNATIDGSLTVRDNNIEIDNGQVVQPISPTEDSHLANKRYVDDSFRANDAMLFKGVLGAGSITALPDVHEIGWTYKVGTAGSYAGQWCEPGDTIYCIADGTAANNADWNVLEYNQEGLVIRATDDRALAVGSEDSPVFVQSSGIVKATTKKFSDYLPLTGGTLTGALSVNNGKATIDTNGYVKGTWLQTTSVSNKGSQTGKVAVIDNSGWIYYRTPQEILEEAGGGNAVAKRYTVTTTAGQTSITFPTTFATTDNLAVYHNGLLLTPTTNYSINADGTGITLGYAAEEGDIITFAGALDLADFTDVNAKKGETVAAAGASVINIPFTITSTAGLTVFENGILISEGNQYTATTTAITLIGYTASEGDIYTFVSDRTLAGENVAPTANLIGLSSTKFSGITNVQSALESLDDKFGSYLTTSSASSTYLPKTGGTLTGGLTTTGLTLSSLSTSTSASSYFCMLNSSKQLIGITPSNFLTAFTGYTSTTSSGSKSLRNIMYKTSAPTSSEGSNGDICIVYAT